jgi:hypothetical protein
MKKIRRDKLVPYMIDKMLEGKIEGVGARYLYISDHQFAEDGTPWYQQYTWSEDEEKVFKDFFMDTLMNKTSPRFTEMQATKEWGFFSLMWGLKRKKE